MKKWKKLIALATGITVLGVVSVGCSDSGAKGTDKKTVKFVLPGINEKDSVDPISGIKQAGLETCQEFFDEQFKDEDVRVEIVSIPWDGWIQKVETLMVSGEADIGFYTNQVAVPEWFQDLTPHLEKDSNLNLTNFETTFTPSAAYYSYYKSFNKPNDTDKIFGLPFTQNTYSIIYDKELFEQWGVAEPTEETTFQELVEMAEQMTGENPVTGEKNYGAYIQPAWLEWYALCYDAVKPMKLDTMDIEKLDMDEYINYIKESDEVLSYFEDISRLVENSPEGISTNSGSEKFFTEENDIAINFNTQNINGSLLTYMYAEKDEVTERFKPILIPKNNDGVQGFPEFFRLGMGKQTEDSEATWKVLRKIVTDKEIIDFYLMNYAKDKLPAITDTENMKIMEYPINQERLDYQNQTAFITDDYWTWRVAIQGVNNEVISKTITPEEAREKFYQDASKWVEETKAQLK